MSSSTFVLARTCYNIPHRMHHRTCNTERKKAGKWGELVQELVYPIFSNTEAAAAAAFRKREKWRQSVIFLSVFVLFHGLLNSHPASCLIFCHLPRHSSWFLVWVVKYIKNGQMYLGFFFTREGLVGSHTVRYFCIQKTFFFFFFTLRFQGMVFVWRSLDPESAFRSSSNLDRN